MTLITGAQARELRDGISPAPWEAVHRNHPMRGGDFISISPANEDGWMVSRSARTVCEVTDNHSPNAELIAAAPALAETVAWLHGHHDAVAEDGCHVIATAKGKVLVWVTPQDHLDPDDAVDLARTILAAAESARHAPEAEGV